MMVKRAVDQLRIEVAAVALNDEQVGRKILVFFIIFAVVSDDGRIGLEELAQHLHKLLLGVEREQRLDAEYGAFVELLLLLAAAMRLLRRRVRTRRVESQRTLAQTI